MKECNGAISDAQKTQSACVDVCIPYIIAHFLHSPAWLGNSPPPGIGPTQMSVCHGFSPTAECLAVFTNTHCSYSYILHCSDTSTSKLLSLRFKYSTTNVVMTSTSSSISSLN